MTVKNKPRPAGDQVSELTAGRLSVYLRCLNTLDAAGVKTISSKALAEQFHLNAAQIRKDLAYFGEFGVRGVGYYVKELKRHLRPSSAWTGRCVSPFWAQATSGSRSPTIRASVRKASRSSRSSTPSETRSAGTREAGVSIYDTVEFRKLVKKENIDIAVVAVPADSAQTVVNVAVQAGIRAILNFSPGSLKVPPGVKLKNVDLTVSLESLSFFLAREEADGDA